MSKYKGKMICELIYSGYIPMTSGRYVKKINGRYGSCLLVFHVADNPCLLDFRSKAEDFTISFDYNKSGLEELKNNLKLIEEYYGDIKSNRDPVTCGI